MLIGKIGMKIDDDFMMPKTDIRLYAALIASASNAKGFAIAFLVFFFLFIFPNAVFGRTGKGYLFMFQHLLPRKRVTRIGLIY